LFTKSIAIEMPPEEKAAPKLQEHMANLALSSIAQIRNKKKTKHEVQY